MTVSSSSTSMADSGNDTVGKEINSVEDMDNMADSEIKLDDDKAVTNNAFKGATLELDPNSATPGSEPGVGFAGPGNPNPDPPLSSGVLSRDRPGSAFGKKSTVSTGSKTAMSHKVYQTDNTLKSYFSKRNGTFENGVELARETILKADLDGEIRGAWLLTEIDHWDHEREKVVMLTDKSMLVLNFDFIRLKILDAKRVMLHIVDHIQVGDMQYPEKSLMQPRDHGGVRIHWGKEKPLSFGQRWNPWCSDIPYTTFTHHPMIYHKNETETVTFNVDDFYESLVQATKRVYQQVKPGENPTIVEEPILIETYASVSSMVFNQSHLGFNRERGGVSF